jgi:fatty-acyl-CoA synthase
VLALYPSHLYQLLDHPDVTRVDHTSLRLLDLLRRTRIADPAQPGDDGVRAGVVPGLRRGRRPGECAHSSPKTTAWTGRSSSARSDGHCPGSSWRSGPAPESPRRARSLAHALPDDPLLARTAAHRGDDRRRLGSDHRFGLPGRRGYVHLVDRLRDILLANANNWYTVGIENVLTGHPRGPRGRRGGPARSPHRRGRPRRRGAPIPTSSHEAELRQLVRHELSELDAPRTVLSSTRSP